VAQTDSDKFIQHWLKGN